MIKRGPQGETVYVNQYFTIRNKEIGTKHVFLGNTRMVSKLMKQDKPGANPQGRTPVEKDLYFFHPDHLGSSHYITDTQGQLFEHLEYFPYGETWVEESTNTQRTPYLFTGKELDEETNLYYFGARYYDPRTSVWQSPDPLLAQFLPTGKSEYDGRLPGQGGVFNTINLAVYSYSHLNPVRNVDPDGREPEPADGGGYLARILIGVAIHNRAITPYFERRGWQTNTTFDASGRNVFGYFRPDIHRSSGTRTGELAEAKPLSYSTGALYTRAQGEVAFYITQASEAGFTYVPATTAQIFEGQRRIDLGVIQGYMGERIRVTLYPDETNPRSGLFFYDYELLETNYVDQTREFLERLGKEILKHPPGPCCGPPGRRDPAHD